MGQAVLPMDWMPHTAPILGPEAVLKGRRPHDQTYSSHIDQAVPLSLQVAKVLLSHGADPKMLNSKDASSAHQ